MSELIYDDKTKDHRRLNMNYKPVKCLLWGTGKAFWEYYYLIKYYEFTGELCVCGVTSSDSFYSDVGGYHFIDKADIDYEIFDVVIIMSLSKSIIRDIQNEILLRGISESNIIPCQVLRLQGFDFAKYKALKTNPPTILAPNCWAGITYNQLGLPFCSPTINMFEDHDDYLKLIMNLEHYLSCDLEFREMQYERNLKRDYPVIACDDVLLHCNHYQTFEEANTAWLRRKDRIRWDNLFIMFFDENPERIDRFCNLRYKKKVCFVPYASEKKDVIPIIYRVNDEMREKPFWEIINGMATGKWPYYDVFELLLNCRIIPKVMLKMI